MAEVRAPFVDSGNGFPTRESVRSAIGECFALGSDDIDELAQIPGSFRGETDTIENLLTMCKIEHLSRGYPESFTAYLLGIVTTADAQESGA